MTLEPYFDDGIVRLYHADCREWLADPPDDVDVMISDPPYGVGLKARSSKAGHYRQASVTYDDDPDEIVELIGDVIPRALEIVDRALIFSGQAHLWDYPPAAAVSCVWHGTAGTGRSSWGFTVSSPILFYGRDPYLADRLGGRPNGFAGAGAPDYPVDHPCPKPERWLRWAVDRVSRPGEVVLDPFAGTGTTLRAAKDMGRRAIGVEISEHYCEIAAKRLGQEVLPFDDVVPVVETLALDLDGPI